MGGMIVQQLAVTYPERLLSMTSLMSTTGNRDFGRPTEEAMKAIVQAPPTDREGWLDVMVSAEKLWCSPDLWDPARVRAKGELMFDYGVSPQGTARQYRAVLASGNRDDALANVSTPTLVLHGSADNLIGPDGGRHTADIVPDASYVEIEGLGHDLPSEMWPRLVSEVAAFAGA
jgi:pimeloyl-ACP methyl ester carboxylesterase